jgi:hypothetical protein
MILDEAAPVWIQRKAAYIYYPFYRERVNLPIMSIGDAANLALDFDKKAQTIIPGERAGKGVSLFERSYDTI